ncbi:MAG TPA: hypothetical protein VM261_26075 [Kofleriaceae bacterium]|nr:hypothetical protein [Kofleriaceae bacterium]
MRPIQIFLVVAGIGLLVTFFLPGRGAPARDAAPAARVVAGSPSASSTSAPTRPAPDRAAEARMPAEVTRLSDAGRSDDLRVTLTARLEHSGTTPAPFHRDVEQLVGGWATSLPAELGAGVEIGAVRCFAAGCSVDTVSRDAIVNEEIGHALSNLPAFTQYPGWRARTGNEVGADGRVTARWFFLAPEPT